MSTYDVAADGTRGKTQGDNVEYVDFSTKSSRAHENGPPGQSAARDARKETHAHASEVDAAVKNTSDEERRQWAAQARKDPRSTVIEGGKSRQPPAGYTPPEPGPSSPEKSRGGR
jgi:hypothetical protein